MKNRKWRAESTDQSYKSSGTARFVAVEFPEHVEGRDEADEAEAHHKHHRRRYLQPRCVVRVESQHVASAAASGAGGWVVPADPSSAETAAAHAGGGGSGSAGSHDSRSRGRGGRCGLRLRGASGHVARDGDGKMGSEKKNRNIEWREEEEEDKEIVNTLCLSSLLYNSDKEKDIEEYRFITIFFI